MQEMVAQPTCQECKDRAFRIMGNAQKGVVGGPGSIEEALGPQAAKTYREKHPAAVKWEPGHRGRDAMRALTVLLHARHSTQKK